MVGAWASGAMPRFGARVSGEGTGFGVWSGAASGIWLSLFDSSGDHEMERLELERVGDGVFTLFVPGLAAGAKYAFRADGPYDPASGMWFDPSKMLMDPYALTIDRPYSYDARLAAPRSMGLDTAPLMPKAIVTSLPPATPSSARFTPGGLIYEINVRGFTMLHPEIPPELRGTVAALAHPAIIGHLRRLGVSAVELMPVTAWIDESHLPPLGLRNAWGYNPVTFMALDPRLTPGGIVELRDTVAALHEAGIATILDLVFNHTGESDAEGPTLSLRGLDAAAYYRHREDGSLVNDTGTGNTVACDHPVVREMIVDCLRHFVIHAGVDGFRFDLATVLGRTVEGFRPDAPLLLDIASDPLLSDRILIAEPWDIGPDGYQLGNFPQNFLEWNDRCRDDMRKFWRGDANMLGGLATRLAGSSDIFARNGATRTRTVNFVAAHDGMTLADVCAYERKHNDANGEDNRDGHNENFSWNNGVEGECPDETVKADRARDVRAMLATLFMSRGAIMLTAGDEFGRTQRGNNNAYAQDNELAWLDWAGRDAALEGFACALAGIRRAVPAFTDVSFLTGEAGDGNVADVSWHDEDGEPLSGDQWTDPSRRSLCMILSRGNRDGGRLAVMINGGRSGLSFLLTPRDSFDWVPLLSVDRQQERWTVAGRTVGLAMERPGGG